MGSGMGKFLKITGSLILIGIIGAVAWFLAWAWAPNSDPGEMTTRYGAPPSQFVSLDGGIRMHYRDQGSYEAPALVLLHGSNSSLHTWEPWVARLKDRYRIITLDLPGHGLTGATLARDYTYSGMADAVDALLVRLGINKAAIAGNSMGGAVAITYALQHPDKVSALVLVDSAGVAAPPGARKTDRPLAFELAAKPWAQVLLQNLTPKSLVREGLLKSVYDPEFVTKEMVERYWDLARYPGNREATGLRFAWYAANMDKSLPVERLEMPTLILWGEEDRLIPVETASLLNQKIDGSGVIIYPETGHLPMEERADETAAATGVFLDQITSALAESRHDLDVGRP